ncbi:hypothetical protein ACROYT_G029458 [Oculina patagonica]
MFFEAQDQFFSDNLKRLSTCQQYSFSTLNTKMMKAGFILVLMTLCLVPVSTVFQYFDDCKSSCDYNYMEPHCFSRCRSPSCRESCKRLYVECLNNCKQRSHLDADTSHEVAI